MGKKLICLIMALCCIFALASCGEKSIAADKAGVDNTLHGGFVAETNGYVYFINGIENYSTTYKPGEVTKGALMRVSKSNLKATPEVVVSRLLVAGDTDAGIYINGEYVYYAVASVEKDKTGNVKSDKLNFFRTKLDASETSRNIADRDFDNSVTYRYIVSGGKVYLVVHSTDLFVYDAENGGLIYTTEVNPEDSKYKKNEDALNADKLNKIDVSEVLFTGSNVYFTSNPINKELSNADNIQKDAFHIVYKINFAGKKADKVINGAGTMLVNGDENPDGGFGLLGVTFDLLRVENETLYFSYTSLNTVEGALPVYMAIPEASLAGIEHSWYTNEEFVYSETADNMSTIFADTSIFYGGKVYYVNANIGLLVYDQAKKDSADTDNGVIVLLSSDLLKGATLDYVNEEDGKPYLYFHDAAGIFYKLDITQDSETDKIADSTVLRINEYALNTAWYKPEVVKSGSKFYFVVTYSDASFKSYVYTIDMSDLKAEDDEEYWENLAEIEKNDDFAAFAKNYNILGVIA